MDHEEKEILIRLLRDTEENSREIARILHTVRKIEKELHHHHHQPLTASVVDVFSGESITMADLILNVGQTSTDTVTPLLADGVTPSGGVVSNLTVTFSDPSATAVVNGANTILITGVAASTGAISGTRACTITDTDGAVSQWTATFTVTTNAPIPPSQLTQSVVDVFSVPTP